MNQDYIHLTRHTPHKWLDAYMAYSQDCFPMVFKFMHEACGVFALSATVGGRAEVNIERNTSGLYELKNLPSTPLNFVSCGHDLYYEHLTARLVEEILTETGIQDYFKINLTPLERYTFSRHRRMLKYEHFNNNKSLVWITDKFGKKLERLTDTYHKDDSKIYWHIRENNGQLDVNRKHKEDHNGYYISFFGSATLDQMKAVKDKLWTPHHARTWAGYGRKLGGLLNHFVLVHPHISDASRLNLTHSFDGPAPPMVINRLKEIDKKLGYANVSPISIDLPAWHELNEYAANIFGKVPYIKAFNIVQKICPKIAALLAIANDSDVIQLPHVMRAVEICEQVRCGQDLLDERLISCHECQDTGNCSACHTLSPGLRNNQVCSHCDDTERCPSCNSDNDTGYITFIEAVHYDLVNISYSEAPEEKLKDLLESNFANLHELRTIKGSEQLKDSIHKRFDHLHRRGDWFDYTDELRKSIAAL